MLTLKNKLWYNPNSTISTLKYNTMNEIIVISKNQTLPISSSFSKETITEIIGKI